MRYNHTEHAIPHLDWTMAQALEGGTVEVQLQGLRAQFEPALEAAYDKVSAERAIIDQLREPAQSFPTTHYEPDVPIEDICSRVKNECLHAQDALHRAEQMIRAFALRHGLSRPPKTPKTFENCIILGLFVLLESGLNGGFLNNANMVAGAIQAFTAAALISLTNVAASTAGGYFIGRWLSYGLHSAEPHYPSFKYKRDAAWIGLFIFVVVMAEFHLTVGLIRAQETLHNVEHSATRYAEILATPEALFLVMVGVVMSAVSWMKGLTSFDDPYPGYGEKQHDMNRVEDQLAGLHEEASQEINARFEARNEELEVFEKTSGKQRTAYNHAVANYLQSARILDRQINQAESQLRMQVALIIHHHRAVRGQRNRTVPSPALEHFIHFDKYRIPNQPVFLNKPDFSVLKANLAEAQAKAQERLTHLFEQAAYTHNGE